VSVKTADNQLAPVLIIGAGTAGLVTGYFLQQRGIPYRIIDRERVLASTWATLYPSLRLNTSRYFSHPPKLPFPLHWGVFITGQQYHAHISRFAHLHRLNVRLGVSVERITPENGGYRVATSEGEAWHPAVVIASGRFGNPHTARLDGLDQFTGLRLHAHEYHHPDQLRGLRVMVVGSGPSGLDIAVETGRHNAPAKPTLLAARSGIALKRRYPLGLPKHGWMLVERALPVGWREPLQRWVERHSDFSPAQLRGIPAPAAGQSSTAAATRGAELIEAVRRGQVVCTPAPVRLESDHAVMPDGTRQSVEALVMATGYRPVLGFLKDLTYPLGLNEWPRLTSSRAYAFDPASLTYGGTYDVGALVDAQFRPDQREIEGYAGLFQVGLYYKGKGTLYNINVEAELAAAQIAELREKACQTG
jgi:putative flavoprotein involved in K+ transport